MHFGKRDNPCEDCWPDGYCSMNCGPYCGVKTERKENGRREKQKDPPKDRKVKRRT